MSRPNQLSTLRIILTPAFLATFLSDSVGLQYASFGIFFLASITDWYDGYIARRSGAVTRWGVFLDPLADKVLMLSAFTALWLRGYVRGWMVVAIAVRDVVVTGLRWYAMFTERPVNTMYVAKFKTTTQIVAIYVILIYHLGRLGRGALTPWLGRTVSWMEQVDVIDKMMIFVTLYTVLTGLIYLIGNRQHVRNLAVSFYRAITPLS